MPQPAAMKFGREPQDPDTDPRLIESSERRAEILCPKSHLLGVVTNDQVCLAETTRVPLATASHEELTWCRRCGRHSSEYYVSIPALLSYIQGKGWRVRVPIEAVSRRRSFH
jgi:hypothetical protein